MLVYYFIIYLKNLGYCPTIYMMFEAMIALLSFPRLISHKPRRSCRITEKQNNYSKKHHKIQIIIFRGQATSALASFHVGSLS